MNPDPITTALLASKLLCDELQNAHKSVCAFGGISGRLASLMLLEQLAAARETHRRLHEIHLAITTKD